MAKRPVLARSCKSRISYEEPPALKPELEKIKKYGKNELFETEVVENDNLGKRIKIHYTGYGKQYDTWVKDNQGCPLVMVNNYFIPGLDSFPDRNEILFENIAEKVQGSLSGDRLKDPHCRLEIDGEEDVFDNFLKMYNKEENGRYFPESYNDLNNVLGSKWDERIYNKLGDFAFVVPDTLKFHVRSRKPATRFIYQGGAFVDSVKKRKPVLIATFVIRSANRKTYENRLKS